MQCDYCGDTMQQRREDNEVEYGVLSIEQAYYPSVKLMCPGCIDTAETAVYRTVRERRLAEKEQG